MCVCLCVCVRERENGMCVRERKQSIIHSQEKKEAEGKRYIFAITRERCRAAPLVVPRPTSSSYSSTEADSGQVVSAVAS